MAEASTAVAIAEPRPARVPLVAGDHPRAIVPTDFDGAWRIGNAVCEAGMAPRGLDTAAKCTIAILQGLEVGLPPMQALQSISVINGRPSLWGDGALGLIQSKGVLEDQDEHYEGQPGTDGFKAVCILKRKGKSRPYVGEFSIAQAKTAGLWTKRGRNGEPTPWQTYPDRMLKMRARAFAMRDGFSDVLKGLGVAEEQEDVERAKAPEPRVDDGGGPPIPAAANDDGGGPPVPPEETTSGEAAENSTADDGGGPPAPADDFPGDKPIAKDTRHAIPEDGGIPEFLRHQGEPVSERSWLAELNAAFEKCADLSALAEVQNEHMTPREGKVSAESWNMACEYLDAHIERIQGAEVWDE
jgi:hypothetical protein